MPEQTPGNTSLKILLLEDDPLDQQLICRELSTLEKEVEVVVVSERMEFIRSLLEFVPDLILSDFHVPGFNGIEAQIMVKQTFPNVPFIILTDEADPAKIKSWYEQGISACLSKSEMDSLPHVISQASKRNADYSAGVTRFRILREMRLNIGELSALTTVSEKMEESQLLRGGEASVSFNQARETLEDVYTALRKLSPIR